jgi:hypothetical protein
MSFWGRSPNTIDRWGDVLMTRRSLVSVSRSFNQLSIPLLYQSFFAITRRQASHFRRTLQTRPALGGYIKRLGFAPLLEPRVTAYYPYILSFCPNVRFCDTELRLCDTRPTPSLRSLELNITQEIRDQSGDPQFLHLLASILQATPQLQHLGVYWLPYRVGMIDGRLFAAIRLDSLCSLHLRVCTASHGGSEGIIPTILLFFSLNLPRLDHLLLEDRNRVGEVFNHIPASWLRHIRQFSVTYDFIGRFNLESNHYALLRKFTLDFSCVGSAAWGQLHQWLPDTQLEEVELFHCTTPICREQHPGYDSLHLFLSICADATATPKLRSLTMDITDLEEGQRWFSTKIVRERLNELQPVVKLIHERGIDPKGLNSSLLLPALQRLVQNASTWDLEP